MRCPPHWPPLELVRPYVLTVKAAATGVEASDVYQEGLGSATSARGQQIQALLTSGNPPSNPTRALAAQLLVSQQAPSSQALGQLRQSLRHGHCSTPTRVVCLPGASP
ncbi:MAG: hypothetical protein RLZZ609_830 [Cyanobacteriota bacterium]|jgi:hypothetical protein